MYKEKLIDLLKSDEQTKTAMEKLEFGCKIIYLDKFDNSKKEYTLTNINEFNDVSKIGNYVLLYGNTFIQVGNLKPILDNSKIIGLPLQESFIRMYCYNNIDIVLKIEGDGRIYFGDEFIVELDNNKDFDNQENIVYKKIYESLLNINK